jgi:hypothetical protein
MGPNRTVATLNQDVVTVDPKRLARLNGDHVRQLRDPIAGFEAVEHEGRRGNAWIGDDPAGVVSAASQLHTDMFASLASGANVAWVRREGVDIGAVKGIEPSLSAWETYRRPWSCWSTAWSW